MTTTAEPRRVALVDLTDEEVAVLATTDGPVVLPYLGTLDDEQVATATTTAYRSLVARGLLTAPTPQEAREAARTSTARGEERVADLPTIVQGWVLHPEATPGTGEEVVQLPQRQGEPDPTPPDELLERLGSALVRADLVVRRAGDHSPELVGVFSGPSGTWTSRSRFGSAAPVVIRPATPDDVRDHVRVALAGEPA